MKVKILSFFILLVGHIPTSLAKSDRLTLSGTVSDRTDLLWIQNSSSLEIDPRKTPSLNIYIQDNSSRSPSSTLKDSKKIISPQVLTRPALVIIEAH